MKVIYFQINTAQEKLKKIVETVTIHFQKSEPICILSPSMAAIDYLDALLWKFPQESFLPHGRDSSELITISAMIDPSSETTIFFNLCSSLPTSELSPTLIYELEDLSSTDAKNSFKSRFDRYHELHYIIECKEAIF